MEAVKITILITYYVCNYILQW